MKYVDTHRLAVSVEGVEVAYVDELKEVYDTMMADWDKFKPNYNRESRVVVSRQEDGYIVYQGTLKNLRWFKV